MACCQDGSDGRASGRLKFSTEGRLPGPEVTRVPLLDNDDRQHVRYRSFARFISRWRQWIEAAQRLVPAKRGRMLASRVLHEFIRSRIEATLGRRSWAWLAREAGIPQSTLATQKSVPRFTVVTLVSVAQVLDRPVAHFLPAQYSAVGDGESALFADLQDFVERHRYCDD